MGKRRKYPNAEDILARPWCYYCERDFDDLKILISHQKAKHYKCEKCGRRLNTAGGLSVHLNQVHKENLTKVENALPNRQEANIEIFGMEGIPEEIGQQHRQRVLQAYYEAEAERRRATGNPPPGGGPDSGGHKKPKVESVEELKKRLEAWKNRKAGGDVIMADAGNGDTVPLTTEMLPDGELPGFTQTQQQPQSYPTQASPPPGGFPPFGMPGQPPFPHAAPGFMPPGQGLPGFPAFPPPGQMPFPQPSAGSPPPLPFQQQQQNGALSRPPSLPTASGLPQRPIFGAPPTNGQQMQQGQASAPSAAPSADPRRRPQESSAASAQPPTITDAAVDSTIANVTGQPQETTRPADGAASEKKSKKEKEKAMRLIYSDNDVSPEEKMAGLSKYAFDPKEHGQETTLGPAEAQVTGVVAGQDDVIDRTE